MGSGSQVGSVANGLYIRKNDGKRMWVLNRTEIWEYTLSTAWDISSATQTGYKDLSGFVERGHDIDFKPDGSVLYVDDRNAGAVWQINLGTDWDVEDMGSHYKFDISGQQDEVRGTQFNQNGTRLFLMDTGRREVLEYSVSNAYNLNSASFIGSFSVASQTNNPRGLTFKPDFTRFYVSDASSNRVYQYSIEIADPDRSAVASSKNKVIANGAATSRIIVTLRDSNGNRLSGRSVSLSSNSSNADIDAVNSTTNSSGEARFDVSNSAEENVTFTARADGITINEQVTVRFVGVDAGESAVASNREKVIANGTAVSRITVTARDEDGDRLEDVSVTLDSNSSNVDIDDDNQSTNSDGEAVFEVRNQTAETVTFTARSMGVTVDETVTVRFVTLDPNESAISSNRGRVQANGVMAATIQVTAKDEDGDELEGVEIDLIPNSDEPEIDDSQAVTNSNGVAEFEVSSTVAENVQFQARGGGVTIAENVAVRFLPVDPDQSEMTISTAKVLANGNAEAAITVTARDEDGNPFGFTKIALAQNGGSSTIEKVQETTNEEGIARFRVRNEQVEEITYSAQATGVTLSETVSVKFVTVDPGQTTVAIDPERVQANGEEESKITITARDADGDVLQGARIQLEVLNGTVSVDDDDQTTNSEGEAIFTVTSELPQIVNFQITAEGTELQNDLSVSFIPVAPVSLSASNVQTREFDANWEVVQGAEHYVVDVSTDSSFTNMVEPYNAFDVGNTTTFTVENVDPGTTYLYRVRAVSDGLTGANSQLIQTTTFPDVPEAVAASARNALKFTANWQEAAGARKYRLDVSTDASFNHILSDYNNLDAGSDQSFTVSNLEPGTNYYYRVRSEAGPRTSTSSNTIETSTLTISSEQSEIASDQLRVLANGEQSNEIRIVVKSDEGILLEGLEVVINQENSSTDIEQKQPVTDEEGVAIFGVSSTAAGTATYTVTAAGKQVGEISVEFLANDGILRFGNNFPNPFRSQTILPLTLPARMMVEIKVYNAIGVPVRTVVQEEMNEGYYEIPFSSNGLASGVYFYRLITEDGIKTRKMVLVK